MFIAHSQLSMHPQHSEMFCLQTGQAIRSYRKQPIIYWD